MLSDSTSFLYPDCDTTCSTKLRPIYATVFYKLVIRLFRFSDTVDILDAAWKKVTLLYGNSKIKIFRDMSTALYKKRKAFAPLQKISTPRKCPSDCCIRPTWAWTSQRGDAPPAMRRLRKTTWRSITPTCWLECMAVYLLLAFGEFKVSSCCLEKSLNCFAPFSLDCK